MDIVLLLLTTADGTTATTFVVTLGSDTTANDLDLLTSGSSSVRTLTFNKTAVVDAAGNLASSHIAFVVPQMFKCQQLHLLRTRLLVLMRMALILNSGDTVRRIVFSEAVDD